MNISYALVKLSGEDIVGIIEEYLSIEGLIIEDINIKDTITIKGRYIKKIRVNFSIILGVGAVKGDKFILKILKVKAGGLRVAISLIHFIFKKILCSFEKYGITIKNKHIIINIKKIQQMIPVTTFTINNIEVQHGFVKLEGENIKINFEKQYKSIDEINQEFRNKKFEKKVIINDVYTKLRNNILNKIPEKIKDISPYILLIPDFISLITRLFKDKRVHIKEKIFLGIIITYLLSPIGFIPNFVPILGSVDDVYIIFYAIDKIVKNIPREIIIENWEGDPQVILNISKIIEEVFEVLGVDNSKKMFISIIRKTFNKKKKKKTGVI